MAQDIYYPSITEIYRALMGKNGPYAYVPRLHAAIRKLYDQPGQKNLDAAKKITDNPTIHKLLDAEHIGVIGNGNTRHSVGNGLIDEFINLGDTIILRKLGMSVQMHEWSQSRATTLFT